MSRISPNAIVLSVFVAAVLALVLSDPGELDRTIALRLGLREVVSTVEASQAVSTEIGIDVGHAVATVVDASPATDDTWVAAAAVLLAYGQDDGAREWLVRVRDETPASRLLTRLAGTAPPADPTSGGATASGDTAPPDGAATPSEDASAPVGPAITRQGAQDAPPPSATGEIPAAETAPAPAAALAPPPAGARPEVSEDRLSGDLEIVRGLEDVPRLARERLAARVLREAGQAGRAEETEAAAGRERDRTVMRLGLVLGILALSGLVGLLMWLFARRIREYLVRRFHGLLPDPPFAVSGATLYTAVVGWLAFHLAISILLPLALAPTGLLDEEPGLLIALSTGASGLFGLVIAHRVIGAPTLLRALGIHVAPFRGGLPQAVLWGWLFYAASIPAWMSAQVLNASLVPEDTVVSSPVIPLLAESGGASGLFLLVLAVAVLAPLLEEAFFRGFVYRVLRERLGVTGAVIVSAAIFSLVHLSFQTVLPLFALGCILALAYEWTGSLVPSIVLHSLNNAISMALVLATLSG